MAPEWGWAWPMNRRILYNRAAADPDGRPWSERKAYVWWDDEQQNWTGHDVPDFEVDQAAVLSPRRGAVGPDALRGDDPFIMQADGMGWLFAPTGLLDGPIAEPLRAVGVPGQQPAVPPAGQPHPARCSGARTTTSTPPATSLVAEVFPYVFTTYRLTEHHTAGGMSRWQPYLAELQPEFFCEVSSGARPGARAGEQRLGDDRHRTDRGRGARAGHRPGRRRCGSAAGPSTRWACRTTGGSAATRWSAATRPTTCSGSPSTRTCTSRSPRWHPATSARADGRGGRRCWSSSGLSPASRHHPRHRQPAAHTRRRERGPAYDR